MLYVGHQSKDSNNGLHSKHQKVLELFKIRVCLIPAILHFMSILGRLEKVKFSRIL